MSSSSSSSSSSKRSTSEISNTDLESEGSNEDQNKKQRRPIRIWCDGCYDMMHHGHANSLRQAKALGDVLIVGVHSDEEILRNKGPPVMHEDERYEAVEACKWVDEVVRASPYVTQLEMMDQYRIDFVVHGDDLSFDADGNDSYGAIKAAGRFRTVPRTQGVSSTDLVGRMLLMTKEHHQPSTSASMQSTTIIPMSEGAAPKHSPYTGVSHFLPTSRKIVQFSEGREPAPGDTIVYIDGAFDMFHVGHVAVLREARKLGQFLIVGVHNDFDVNRTKGSNYPIMNLHERVLCVLSCRYVDEVVIGAPYSVTQDMIDSLKIAFVVHGSNETPVPDVDGTDPYALPRRLGIYRTVQSPRELTTGDIVRRLIENRAAFEKRNREKEAREIARLQ